MKTIKYFQRNKCSAGDALVGCLLFILVIAGAAVFAGGYFGLIPAVSKVLGTNKTRDLGVKYANVDVAKIHATTGTQTITTKGLVGTTSGSALEAGIIFEGTKPAKYAVTSEELTAMANTNWKYNIFSDIQIKIGDDGVVETSAMLRVDKIIDFARSMGFSQADVEKAMKEYKIPMTNVPVYGKGNFSVTDGVLAINPQVVEIGRVKLPESILSKAVPPATEAVDGILKSFPGFSVNNLSFDNGKMNFDGNVPAKQTIVTE